jgi:hypothetical protein
MMTFKWECSGCPGGEITAPSCPVEVMQRCRCGGGWIVRVALISRPSILGVKAA